VIGAPRSQIHAAGPGSCLGPTLALDVPGRSSQWSDSRGDDELELKHKDIARLFQVKPGRKFKLTRHDPAWAGGGEFKELRKPELKDRAVAFLKKNCEDLAAAQELLYASDVCSVLIVLQAMDAAGKDGTIKHVMSGVNPQGCQVFAFKKPSDEELDHNFLWRYMKDLPERGRIGIFNRSYYEDVLVVRVHPEILAHQKLPPGDRGDSFWKARFDDINRFERHLTRNGTLILKFFLNVSKKEQKKRFLERLEHGARTGSSRRPI
jgi:PPK2 family polyphosphate:nucleotide phosphotransferase